MRRWFIGAIVLAQVLVLAFMAAEREGVLRTGRIVRLRTLPVDPRDPFRGDYVRFDYEINHVPTNRCDGDLRRGLRETDEPRDLRVYAALDEREEGTYRLLSLSARKPADGLFLRGRIGAAGHHGLDIRYGIEACFVQQGKGLEIERGRQVGDARIPLEVDVAIATSGLAVLKGYRWSPLGIGLRLDSVSNRLVRAATVRLVNAGSNDLAIVDLPRGASLRLEADRFRRWWSENWTWVGEHRPPQPVTDEHVVLLRPGEGHSMAVDLTNPEWFVRNGTNAALAVGGLGWQPVFRFVYCPPSRDACTRLTHAAWVWHGELHSSAFTGSGRAD